ncbi:MAG: hypothetical protein OHK93_007356 [Ramalina farinacea]|uniref:Trichothecene 3-O-acetyltransferase n=1 Tax=Ramalina farinacea TaxID=258253 RepID=A0AA43QKB5_9LECA|nr:hypothetical protein [Ramalina farinacea]
MVDVNPQEEPTEVTKLWPSNMATQGPVVPRGDEYLLSDLDMISPDTLVTSFLVYESQNDQQFQLISDSLAYALKVAAERLPPIAAKIHFDSARRPHRRMTPGCLQLHVRRFEDGEHKPYNQLEKGSFSPYDFDRLRLLPEGAYADTGEKAVFMAQLNRISGGLILALGFNHIATDGGGRSLATTMICSYSKSYLAASSLPPFSFDFNRGPLAAPSELLDLPKEQLLKRSENHQIIDIAPTATNGIQQPHQTNGTPASPPRGLIYRIEGPAVQKLKESCKPLNGAKYVSSYDSIIGLLWTRVLHIRAEMKPHLQTGDSRLLHPIDLRSRGGTAIPKSYFGNAVTVASAGPVRMADLLGPDGLSCAASSIRASIEQASVASIAPATALGHMVGPTEKVVFRPKGGLAEENVMFTTWYFNRTEAYDFGVGPPSAVRTWAAPVPGFFILFPDCERRQDSRVYDLFVTLPKAEQETLSKDDEMQRWFRIL